MGSYLNTRDEKSLEEFYEHDFSMYVLMGSYLNIRDEKSLQEFYERVTLVCINGVIPEHER